ncbi:MAG: universal stress protein [Thermodesulfovibrionales bacterium]|jgi:nucleotide-binding universal stress UspA family protein
MNKILVAFDGSPKAYEAFEYALTLAAICNTKSGITVLSVAQPPEPIDIVEVDAVIDAATEHYKQLFGELKEKANQKNIEIQTEIVVGHPADQIVRYATEYGFDQIIMGQKGKSKIESWLLGSVSKRVSTYSPCTVTIVK